MNEFTNIAFRHNLRNARLKNNLTQVEVSKKAHISERAYQNYELGQRIPNAIRLKRLAEALDVSVDELLSQ